MTQTHALFLRTQIIFENYQFITRNSSSSLSGEMIPLGTVLLSISYYKFSGWILKYIILLGSSNGDCFCALFNRYIHVNRHIIENKSSLKRMLHQPCRNARTPINIHNLPAKHIHLLTRLQVNGPKPLISQSIRYIKPELLIP